MAFGHSSGTKSEICGLRLTTLVLLPSDGAIESVMSLKRRRWRRLLSQLVDMLIRNTIRLFGTLYVGVRGLEFAAHPASLILACGIWWLTFQTG